MKHKFYTSWGGDNRTVKVDSIVMKKFEAHYFSKNAQHYVEFGTL